MKNTTDTRALRGESGNLFDKKDVRKQCDAFLAWEELNAIVLSVSRPMTFDEMENYCGVFKQSAHISYEAALKRAAKRAYVDGSV